MSFVSDMRDQLRAIKECKRKALESTRDAYNLALANELIEKYHKKQNADDADDDEICWHCGELDDECDCNSDWKSRG